MTRASAVHRAEPDGTAAGRLVGPALVGEGRNPSRSRIIIVTAAD